MAQKTQEAPRLKQRYESEVRPQLQRELGLRNVMDVPRLEKIVLNMGLGEAVQNPKIILADEPVASLDPRNTQAGHQDEAEVDDADEDADEDEAPQPKGNKSNKRTRKMPKKKSGSKKK